MLLHSGFAVLQLTCSTRSELKVCCEHRTERTESMLQINKCLNVRPMYWWWSSGLMLWSPRTTAKVDKFLDPEEQTKTQRKFSIL